MPFNSFLVSTEENHEKPQSGCLCRDLNLTEYRSRVLLMAETVWFELLNSGTEKVISLLV
jgi:hypothetical protein